MAAKRLFDIFAACVGLVLLAPVFAAIALAVKLDSRGPILYRARRIGRGGRLFHMYKFRTMIANADGVGPALTYRDDPRITRVGRLLRKVRLDELPQLLNVLKGDMSVVGPRPEAPEYVRPDQPVWREVLSVRPGICGLAQLTFAVDEAALLANQASVDQVYVTQILPEKLRLDLRYIYKRSILFDIKLLVQTALVLVRSGWSFFRGAAPPAPQVGAGAPRPRAPRQGPAAAPAPPAGAAPLDPESDAVAEKTTVAHAQEDTKQSVVGTRFLASRWARAGDFEDK